MNGTLSSIEMNSDILDALTKALRFVPLSDSERDTVSNLLLETYGKEIREFEIAQCMQHMVDAGLLPTGRDGAATITAERYGVSASTVSRFNAKYFQNSGNLTTKCDDTSE
ncbi:MAG: hypothetical protein KME67_10805 [Candidatus Thiodiazotropha sp. (ex Codakia orbicularis)]|nr:hypothetical protein [Candidatus Thiodiazotropha sp. (ex Codakia orbicularis)]